MLKLKPIPATLLLLIICLSSCAGMKITTWVIDKGYSDSLVRKKDNVVTERKSLQDADGYRCYSEEDDKAWRLQLKLAEDCCSGQ